MSLRVLMNGDAILSIAFHCAKALVALLVNWLVLKFYSVDDYVLWAVASSILMIAPTSEMGIGQLTVTRLIHNEKSEWRRILDEATYSLIPLMFLAGLFVFLALAHDSLGYASAMAVILAVRLIAIPYSAVLNAMNQFKARKAFEFIAYALAALLIWAIAVQGLEVRWALIVLNASFTVGAFGAILYARRFLPPRAAIRAESFREIRATTIALYRSSIPFMLVNLSGLLTYGGFIWAASFVLGTHEVAKLSILHAFILMNLYQVYDVFLKARQADLASPQLTLPYRRLNTLMILTLPVVFAVIGPPLLPLFSENVDYTRAEIALFGLFMACELGNLFALSVAQMRPAMISKLQRYCLLRLMIFFAFVLPLLPMGDSVSSLSILILGLSVISGVTLLYLSYQIAVLDRFAPEQIA
jgi:hypothetical protein